MEHENDSTAADGVVAVTTTSNSSATTTTHDNDTIFGRNNKLYGMFEETKHQGSDSGSLFWCGILHWQRNKDLFERWRKEEGTQGGGGSTTTATQEGTQGEEKQDDKENDKSSSTSSSSTYTVVAQQHPIIHAFFVLLLVLGIVWTIDPDNRLSYFMHGLMGLLILAFVWKLFEFQVKRIKFRQQLAEADYYLRKKKKKNDNADDDDEGLKLFMKQHQQEIEEYGVHNIIGGARSDNGLCCNRYNPDDHDPEEYDRRHQTGCCWVETWKFFWRDLLCGILCGCNIQLFGMCAIAQESRYLKNTLPSASERPDLWQRDFITMQPWSEYYPSILRLRLAYDTNPLAHVKAMSTLSKRILVAVSALFLFISLLVLLPIPISFPRFQVLILYGTFAQPVVFLLFVHWTWNLFDLSLDAVVKYAAAGFFICTSCAIVYEKITVKFAERMVQGVQMVGAQWLKQYRERILEAEETQAESLPDEYGGNHGGYQHYMLGGPMGRGGYQQYIPPPEAYELIIAVIGALVQAFFVAAMVEEFCKYFAFMMMEHPDLAEEKIMLPPSTSTTATNGGDDNDEETETTGLLGTRDLNPLSSTTNTVTTVVVAAGTETKIFAPKASLVSRGEAYTVAMVALALGFATAENLIYIFIYTKPNFDSEISTLYIRCLFPIHPLCLAIQSISVVRRDLEKDKSVGIGTIIFPAWMLHGCFDFALMGYSAIHKVMVAHQTSSRTARGDAVPETASTGTGIPYLVYVMIIPFLAMVYFLYESALQRERLAKMDQERMNIAA
mmetsp:Transcript_14892/g.17248  ORF Transcript_14892/g.17248 Transcript_14892/m.17248 type:complete len:781 (+) Transcript_14892:212-2554(+)